jgi:hypothetical protein
MKKLIVLIAAALLVSAAFANTPQSGYNGTQNTGNAAPAASYAAWEFSSPGNEFTNGNWTFGEVFVPTSTFTMDFLGYYNPTGGMSSPHPVGIFNGSGTLLRSTVVTSSSLVFTSHFLYNQVAPLTLFAGQTYVVEGVSNADLYAWNDPGFTVFAPINVLGNNWVSNGGLTFNGTGLINDVNDGYWGPNFGWQPTPEPGSLMLLGTGIVGLAGVLRRKINL